MSAHIRRSSFSSKSSCLLHGQDPTTYLGSSLVLGDPDDVETDRLGKRAALADGDDVSDLDAESGRAVGSEVLVALLVPRVLGDEVLRERGSSGQTGIIVKKVERPGDPRGSPCG